MLTEEQYKSSQLKAGEMIKKSGIFITDAEISGIIVHNWGLDNFYEEGLMVLTWFATERISARVLVLFPNQTEPEHWHPPLPTNPGKEEIIRAVYGDLRFYLPGEDNLKEGFIPASNRQYYTLRNEIIMKPGDQLILTPGTKHWFQAGPEGAVFYSFATCVSDGTDKFENPNIKRMQINQRL
jgi:D-lyxose ketol-isomerase